MCPNKIYLAGIDRHYPIFLQFFLFNSSYCNVFNSAEIYIYIYINIYIYIIYIYIYIYINIYIYIYITMIYDRWVVCTNIYLYIVDR